MTRLISILAFVLVSAVAQATTYYIDYVGGSDSNNGTSEASPWKHYPMDSRATGTADTTTIVAGDILAPKGGVEYVVSVQKVFPVGSVGSRVVIDGALWGTGKALEVGNNQATGAWTDNGASKSNITIRNIIFRDFGGYTEDNIIWDGITIASIDTGTDTFTTSTDHGLAVNADVQFSVSTGGALPGPLVGGVGSAQLYYIKSTPTANTFTLSTSAGGATTNITTTGSGTIKAWEPITNPPNATAINIDGGGENITIEDCEMYEIGQWQNKFPMRGTNSATGTGVWIRSANNLLIEDCIMQRIGKGFQITANPALGSVSDVTINRCSLSQNFVWCMDISPQSVGSVLENITVSNCKFFDYLQFDQGNWAAFDEKPHSNGIFMRTAGMASTWTNVRIHGNEFYIDNAGASAGGTADIFISEGPSALIYNNIFFNTRKANAAISVGWWTASLGQIVRIYNNTFHGSATWIRTGIENRGSTWRQVHFANNIGYATGTASNLIMVTQETGSNLFSTLNRNLYYSPNYTASQNRMFGVNGFIWATLAETQAMGAGRPTQFETDSRYQNPLFTDVIGAFAQTDFRVQTGSQAITLGENLSAYFTTDKDGNARPASGAWTVGAYEYGGAPPADVTAPTYISGAVNSSGETVSVVFSEPVQGIDLTHYAISGHSLSGLTGAGANWSFTISPVKQAGAAFSMTYTSGAGRTRDLADNLLATGTFTIANGSLEETPIPPLPGRRGVGKPRGLIAR